jgi:hypothetical protein
VCVVINRVYNSNHPERAAQDPSLPVSSRAVQSAWWAQWIPQLFPPAQFVTNTYDNETSWRSCLRRHGYVVQQINRKVFGNNWHRHGEGISYVIGVEAQRRGVLHTHAVWDVPYVPYDLVHSLEKSIGGRIWIEPVTKSEGVAYYVTKYAVKTGQVWLYLSRQLQALRAGPGSL